jgi:AcrR family transcriptional regulator
MSGAERREQLLDVTKAIVLERGFHAVSIEAIAREAGITRPVVYGHFEDLPGLLEALVEREGERALGQLAPILPRDLDRGDPVEILLAGLEGYLRAAEADPGTWRLVLMPPEGAPALLREAIATGRAAVIAQLAAAVRPGLLPEGGLPDPELTARLLSTISDEAVRLLLTDPGAYPVERLMTHARWALERLLSDRTRETST